MLWAPTLQRTSINHFAHVVDAVMSYYLIGYGNMPFLEMIVNQYCKNLENYVPHLIKLFWVYYKTNISSVNVLHEILGNGIFLTSQTCILPHFNFPQVISDLELIFFFFFKIPTNVFLWRNSFTTSIRIVHVSVLAKIQSTKWVFKRFKC